MSDAHEPNYPDLRDDQILSIGIYGEQVACYRYTVLSESLPTEEDRAAFAAIAREERGHAERIEALRQKHYPDRSFFLTDQDKALVVAGPRLVNVRDIDDYRQVMKLALDTELNISKFYRVMSGRTKHADIAALLGELSDESADHHRRLVQVARERGFLPPDND
jgi:rubrerythrin